MMGWKYYNHAMIPDTAPHKAVDTTPIKNGQIWKWQGKRTPLLARWAEDFDCGYETKWWYLIKSEPFSIDGLKAKRRYEVNKGRKNFNVQIIHPADYSDALYQVQVAAFSAYPEKYRPVVNLENFVNSCKRWPGICFGAFLIDSMGQEDGKLCGYAYLEHEGNCIQFCMQKTMPEYERLGVNAALVDGFLSHYADQLKNGTYICDGERSVNHEISFQDYLEKYFGFRKAYCKLHIAYHPVLGVFMPVLRLIRAPLKKYDHVGMIHLVNAVLKMDSFAE